MSLSIAVDPLQPELAKASPVFTWDDEVKRFRRRGRFVSLEDVAKLRDDYLVGEQAINDDLAQRLFNREITISEWVDEMRAKTRRVFTTQYMIAKGGRAQMTQRDWGALGQMLREQYGFINNFATQIANGRYNDDQMQLVANRMGLYDNASNQAFERGSLEKWRGIRKFLQWVRSNLKDSCSDCIRLDGQIHTADEYLQAGVWPQRGSLACLGIHRGCSLIEVDATESSGGF